MVRGKAVLCVLLMLGCGQPLAAEYPNILLFIADDLGYLDIEPNGSPDAETPNIARLAAQGMQFKRAYVNSPSCAPSRAALFTALRSARNGVEANHDKTRLPGVSHALGGLKSLGYDVASFGKVRHASNRDVDSWDHGIDHIGSVAFDQQEIESYLQKRDSSRPLLLMVGSKPPHVPWPQHSRFDPKSLTLPPKSVDTPQTRINWSQYLEDVKTMDTYLGETMALFEQYVDANSITVFTSDHGAQWPFGKWNLYETSTRVPLIVRWPGHVDAGQSQAMVSWIDIFPTLTDLAGGTVKADIDGRSFAGVLSGKHSAHRSKVFTTHTGDGGNTNNFPMRAVVTEQYKYIRNLHPEYVYRNHLVKNAWMPHNLYWPTWVEKAHSDEQARQTVLAYLSRPAEELYDLNNDPYEERNLAQLPDYRDTLLSLRQEVEQLIIQSNDQELTTLPGITFAECWLTRCILSNTSKPKAGIK